MTNWLASRVQLHSSPLLRARTILAERSFFPTIMALRASAELVGVPLRRLLSKEPPPSATKVSGPSIMRLKSPRRVGGRIPLRLSW